MPVTANNFGINYFAFPVVASSSCDYPAVADVQEGVSYSNGDLVGTLELPAAGDVRSGTSYGGNGTEFTGTLSVGYTVSPSQQTGLLSKLTTWLPAKQRNRALGKSITYTRTGTGSVTLTVFYADNVVTGFSGGSSARDRVESIGFMIKVSELTIGGDLITPTRGDTITIDGRTYGLKPQDGDAIYTYADPDQEWFRVEAWSGAS